MKLTEQRLKEIILEELDEMIGGRGSAIEMAKSMEKSLKSKKPSLEQIEAEISQLEKMLADLRKMKDSLKK